MAIDRNDTEERQARLDAMIEEFRAAQQRRAVSADIAHRKRIETAQQAMACVKAAARDKVN